MDITQLLGEVEETFPVSGGEWKRAELEDVLKDFTSELMLSVATPLVATSKAVLPAKPVQQAHLDAYWHSSKSETVIPHPHICTARVRPHDKYTGVYHRNDGQVAHSGVAVELELFAPFSQGRSRTCSTFDVVFTIWGSQEREYFRRVLSEHKGIIREILDLVKPEFEGACYLENKKVTAIKHLENYYSSGDPESNFSFRKTHALPVSSEDICRDFLCFMCLFGAVLIYSKEPKANYARALRLLSSKVLD